MAQADGTMIKERMGYYKRISQAYIGGRVSHITFWRERPAENPNCSYDTLGEYYMTFEDKARYEGPFDGGGVPLLDYRGKIGKQYNPIATAQYGLANWNKYKSTGDEGYIEKAMRQADWLIENLAENQYGVPVWNHNFDWEYREMLRAPWYSGLAQGNGISLLARMADETGEEKYRQAAEKAYLSMTLTMDKGGVIYMDEYGNPWIEEVIVNPPTHILNGFLWALWGVWDFYLLTERSEVKLDFDRFVNTLVKNLQHYDAGYWSLYELAGLRLKMLASSFYHSLHCVQLRVTAAITGNNIFLEYAERWEGYSGSSINRSRALVEKALFKAVHY